VFPLHRGSCTLGGWVGLEAFWLW